MNLEPEVFIMKVATAEEMREIDRVTTEEYSIQSLVLMERAGLAVASMVKELCPNQRVLVICGSGNNGGDGIVVARNLHNEGFKVNVVMLAQKDSLSPDCSIQYQIAKKIGLPLEFRNSLNRADIHGAVVVDAVFGTGLVRSVKERFADIFASINNSGVPVIAVDIPSGVSSDTGEVLGEAIKADYTVTFGLPKRGHLLYPGAEYTGRLFVEDIGFPARLLTSSGLKVNLIEREVALRLIPQRPRYSHKGDYGHILIIAGSSGKTGAALMTAKASLRSGAGLVTLAAPESLMDIFQSRATEEMTLSLPDSGNGMLSLRAIEKILDFAAQKADVIAIGPGIGVSPDTERIMGELIQKSTIPMVIDADGINSIKAAADLLKKARSPIILTPHPGEMARLLNQDADPNASAMRIHDIEKDRLNIAMEFSKKTGAYLVLKGAPTIIAEPEGNAFINTTGNPGMASAGSGDVLTGIIPSLLGQGLNPLNASLLGVYLHGLAGDIAAKEKGEHSVIASDIIDFLADAFCYTA
ncbi:NAD(P)H-hydrate dehydratase [Thermodesulfovibrionales bacterium]|nr:NAD(P)H-hydrate dehydratase [Thermodesulfovibrionales bacterium]